VAVAISFLLLFDRLQLASRSSGTNGGWACLETQTCLSLAFGDYLGAMVVGFLGLACRAWYVFACSGDGVLSRALVSGPCWKSTWYGFAVDGTHLLC
jgi:hypothetical protein